MSLKKPRSLLAALAPLLLVLSCAVRADGPTPSAGLPSAPLNVKDAESQEQLAADMRRDADRRRTEAEAIRQRDDSACYDKFLVNACRDKVRQAHIARMRAIRQTEIDANQIDRIAKARKIELEAGVKEEPRPTARPLPQASAPAASPAATESAPGATVPADVQRRADAARAESIRRAEEDKRARNADAAERAEKARKDAARYDQRIEEQARKKAAKAGQSAPAPAR